MNMGKICRNVVVIVQLWFAVFVTSSMTQRVLLVAVLVPQGSSAVQLLSAAGETYTSSAFGSVLTRIRGVYKERHTDLGSNRRQYLKDWGKNEKCSPALISWGDIHRQCSAVTAICRSDQKDWNSHGDLTVVMDFKSKNLKCIETQHVTYKQHTIWFRSSERECGPMHRNGTQYWKEENEEASLIELRKIWMKKYFGSNNLSALFSTTI